MKVLRIGIASYEEMKARTIAIARGQHRTLANEPKVWFTSAESFARVLSDKNRTLLHSIAEARPNSLKELAELTGRKKSNLSRTLKTMSQYGLVVLKKGERGSVIPRVPYERISLVMPLARSRKGKTRAA